MNGYGGGDNDLTEREQQLQKGSEGVEDDGVVSARKEQNLVEDVGCKIDDATKNVKGGHGQGANSAPCSLQISLQQQSQGAIVCWERFLHLRSLKVLLVEYDDSTRHIVAALLRNCSYEVIEAANGIQAWKILEDLTNHIDLVLTEVVMPCLSGIGLLCKIMSHKTRKNVPVIMMSSHDSMGLVFKCLSKGAVDFLVKPIRKNELKNLWQHVWRRCHSSSGSGSESGTQTQKSVKSKSVEKSEQNSGGNDGEENGSIGLNVSDGSDDGSGAQSSWTKQAVEVDSPRLVSLWDQAAECPDSTCAQVIHSNAEISANKQGHGITTKEHLLDNIASGQNMDKGFSKSIDKKCDYPDENLTKFLSSKQNNLHLDEVQLDLNTESPVNPNHESANPANVGGTHVDTVEFEPPNRNSKVSDIKNKAVIDSNETPKLEHSLKRLRGVKDAGKTVQDDRNVLRRSNSSAFSRYNAASNVNKVTSGSVRSVSPHDTRLDIMKRGSVCNVQSLSIGDQPNQGSNVGSNNFDMGSTTNNTSPNSAVMKKKPEVTSMVKCLQPPCTFQPMKGDTLCASQQIASEKAGDVAGTAILAQTMGTHQELQVQHLTKHCDHQPHLTQNMQMQQQLQHQPQKLQSDHDDSSLKKMAVTAPHCGSSNVLGGPVEGNACNYSINGSATGSNHGSNGQNGSSTAVNAGGANIESDNAIARSDSGDASGSGSGSGSGGRVDQNKFAQREAALTKFRQKRKDRCFRKKVRYQSRKKLAEQRPRVRGQFIRQATSDNTNRGTES